jgi:hypothetical protein
MRACPLSLNLPVCTQVAQQGHCLGPILPRRLEQPLHILALSLRLTARDYPKMTRQRSSPPL